MSLFNSGVGLFGYSDIWEIIFIVSVVVFGLSVALLFKKKKTKASAAPAKRHYAYILLLAFGITLILGAVPAGFMLVLEAGRISDGGNGAIGFVLMGAMIVGGIVAIIYAIKRRAQS